MIRMLLIAKCDATLFQHHLCSMAWASLGTLSCIRNAAQRPCERVWPAKLGRMGKPTGWGDPALIVS